ncbi:MAG: Inward rectifier potassium channel [Burkholderiales bacterium]|nr:Inward rectifier potassium channel [Burkholderiales bacterium]
MHGHSKVIRLGNSDIVTHGLSRPFGSNTYHFFLTLRWWQFFAINAAIFLAINAVFAVLYMLGGAPIANQSPPGFWGAFFFSVETLATVGYGDMHPMTLYGHVVATTEIFAGMSNVAIVTGLIFARFSRPRAIILFAEHPIVHPVNGKQTLTIRAANARQNVIVEANARLRLIRREVTSEGYVMRRIHDLELVRDQQPMFVLGWNIMHVIDESSPLWGTTAEELVEKEGGLILTISGVDETTSQSMQGRKTYGADTMRWNMKYRDLLHVDDDGVTHMDFNHFHEVQPLRPEHDDPSLGG